MSFINKNKVQDLYYNINVINKLNTPIELKYSDIRNSALIDNVDNYMLHIPRFQADLSEIPLMYWPTTQSDEFLDQSYSTIDNNYYSITLEKYGPTTYNQHYAYYIPYGRDTPEIYHFQDFCDMLNVAIYGSFITLALPGTDRPYFYYDKDNACINLALPLAFKSQTVPTYGFYVNENLYNAFAKDLRGTITNLSDGRYYKINNERH